MRHATRLFVTRLLVLVGTLTFPAAILAMGKPQPAPCPADPAAAVAAACPCTGSWKNHGQFVHCVVHMRNVLRKDGCLAADLKPMARCAARSTCGKDTVLCCHFALGTSSARLAHDATACMADGGVVVAGGGSVCTPCPPPPSTTTTTLH